MLAMSSFHVPGLLFPAKPAPLRAITPGLRCGLRPGRVVGITSGIQDSIFSLVKFVRQAPVDILIRFPWASSSVNTGSWLHWLARKRTTAFLSQVFLQNDRVSRVAFIYRVCEISEERNEANDEIDQEIEHHRDSKTRWETTVDFFAGVDDHHRKRSVSYIAKTSIGISYLFGLGFMGNTHNGTNPMTLLQPKRIPHKLNRL